MATAVIENLDFTNIDRFEICPNDENANVDEVDIGETIQNKDNPFYFGTSSRKRGGRFKQVVHAFLGFGGGTHTDHSKGAPIPEKTRDFMVFYYCINILYSILIWNE